MGTNRFAAGNVVRCLSKGYFGVVLQERYEHDGWRYQVMGRFGNLFWAAEPDLVEVDPPSDGSMPDDTPLQQSAA